MSRKFPIVSCRGVLLAACFWAMPLAAQKLDFERLSSELGLSQNMVYCLCQDSKGFLWVGTKDGLNRFDGHRFIVFRYDPFDLFSISGNEILSILEDRYGRMWVSTDKGIDLFDREKEVFYALKTPASNQKLLEDPQGNIWQGGLSEGLLKISLPAGARTLEKVKTEWFCAEKTMKEEFATPVWDAAGRAFVGKVEEKMYCVRFDSLRKSFQVDRNFEDLPDATLRDFLEKTDGAQNHFYNGFEKGRDGKIWMSNGHQLLCWDARSGVCTQFDLPEAYRALGPSSKGWGLFDAVAEDGRGRLWLGGFYGAYRVDLGSRAFSCFSPEPNEESDPLLPGLAALLEDKGGLVWVGTRGKGLLKYNDNARRFAAAYNAPGLWKGQSIRALYKTSDGRLWLATASGQLYWFNQQANKVDPVAPSPSFFGKTPGNAFSFYQDKSGALWIGDGNLGLVKATGWQNGRPRFEAFPTETARPWKANYAPTKIIEDASQHLWMVSPDALRRFDPRTKAFEQFAFFGDDLTEIDRDWARVDRNTFPTLFEDRRGRLWVGTCEGLWRFDPDKKTFERFQSDREKPGSLSHDLVRCIAEDPEQPDRVLWIGTGGGGLNRFDTETGVFEKFTEKDGLPDMVVYGILSDKTGNLWLSTNKGLSVLDRKSRVFRNFDRHDGLQSLEFNTLAYHQSADGQLFFGGVEGFNAFYPARMLQANTHVPNIVFTDFKISNRSVSVKTPGSPLKAAIAYTQKITLPPEVKIISFEFAALDFADPSKNQFACKMEHFDRDWQYLGTTHTVTYTNLGPGKYSFRVRGTNNDRVWSEADARIDLEILAPWWATWWAYTGYALAAGALFFAFLRLQIKRDQAKSEAHREKELNEAKSQFLSTVNHELRTPLTSIMGFIKIIKKRMEERILPNTNLADPKTERAAAQVMDNLNIVILESERLSILIDEVLDLAKIEAGKAVWHEERVDMAQIIERAVAATATLFEQKGLQLHTSIEPGLPETLGDPNRLLQVMVNLLSNAAKFTERGAVTCTANQQDGHTLLIGVADTGIGIPETYRALIFEKFQQVSNDALAQKPQGTGLGLPICREIVKHHGGQIWVESEMGKGSVFFFSIPVRGTGMN